MPKSGHQMSLRFVSKIVLQEALHCKHKIQVSATLFLTHNLQNYGKFSQNDGAKLFSDKNNLNIFFRCFDISNASPIGKKYEEYFCASQDLAGCCNGDKFIGRLRNGN